MKVDWAKAKERLPKWARKNEPCSRTTIITGILLVVVASTLLSLSLQSQLHYETNGPTFRPDPKFDRTGSHGAVASDVPLCSQLGVSVLERGGSAADAAVTVALCIGSTIPHSSGIGGGGFINVRFPNGTTLIIDARETAPAGATKHMFDKNPFLSKWGGLASGVPGELAGLEKLYEIGSSGNFEWAELVNQIADLNEAGFNIGESVLEATMVFGAVKNITSELFDQVEELSDWGWLSDAARWGKNGWIKRPAYASTLRKIAEGGARAFYDPEGDIAPHLAQLTQAAGGVMTVDDFANYSVILREPLITTFRGRTFYTSPNPTSGPALVLGLGVIEQLLDLTDPLGGVELQRIVETMKWMASARSHLGDPDFANNAMMHDMLTPEYAQQVLGNISDEKTLDSWRDYHPSYEINEPHGTSHFSVVDADGMAVAMTTTVNLYFGNLLCDPVTGVIMNSEMDDFSVPTHRNSFELQPSIYNFVAPGKRPLSSTVPTIGVDPETNLVEIVIGAAGGSHILTAVFEALTRIYGFNVSLLDAVSYPRVHHQLIPEEVMIEKGMPDYVFAQLKEKGHEVNERVPSSAMNGILRTNGILHAVSDFYRKGGIAAAY